MHRNVNKPLFRRFVANFGAVLAVVGATLAPFNAVADPVKVRAWSHPGFGRIVFQWPAPADFETSQAGVSLSIKFNRKIEAVYGAVSSSLGEYIAKTTTGAGGQTTILALKPGVTLRQATASGSAVIIDLVKAGAGAAAAPKTAPVKRASTGKPISVRVGAHDNYSRIVFDWTRSVKY
jgi:hypothetical protein